MPRDGSNQYFPPPGTTATPFSTIESTPYNNFVADIAADQNNPRPVNAGGTGASTRQGALDAFFNAARTLIDERVLFVDPGDATKRARLDVGAVAGGQTRVITVPDENVDLGALLKLTGGTLTGPLNLTIGTAPADPGAGLLRLYALTGGLLSTRDENGVESVMWSSTNLLAPDQSEAETGTATDLRAWTAQRDRQAIDARVPPDLVCKAWVNFNGTGTVAIRDSYNVSSITDNGVGNYTINFTNAMPNANYAVVCSTSGESNNHAPCIKSLATGSVGLDTWRDQDSTYQRDDKEIISVVIFAGA
jgi:hypothetical protein